MVHRKPHRVKGLEVRHRVWQGNLHAWFGIVSLTRSAPRLTQAGQGQSGCVSIFRKFHQRISDVFNLSLEGWSRFEVYVKVL